MKKFDHNEYVRRQVTANKGKCLCGRPAFKWYNAGNVCRRCYNIEIELREYHEPVILDKEISKNRELKKKRAKVQRLDR